MELITNKLDDLRLVRCRYADIEIPIYIDKHSESVFVSIDDLPLLLSLPPDNTDSVSYTNLKKAIAKTFANESK